VPRKPRGGIWKGAFTNTVSPMKASRKAITKTLQQSNPQKSRPKGQKKRKKNKEKPDNALLLQQNKRRKNGRLLDKPPVGRVKEGPKREF